MQHYAEFHLGLNRLQKYSFMVSRIQRVNGGKVLLIYYKVKGLATKLNFCTSQI